MKKHYIRPALEVEELRLHDVILYSPPQYTDPYEGDIILKKVMRQELQNNGILTEETVPPLDE